jgi:hypothetical protein
MISKIIIKWLFGWSESTYSRKSNRWYEDEGIAEEYRNKKGVPISIFCKYTGFKEKDVLTAIDQFGKEMKEQCKSN